MQITNVNLQFAYENFLTRFDEVKEYLLLVQSISEMDTPRVFNHNTLSSNNLFFYNTTWFPIHTPPSLLSMNNSKSKIEIDTGISITRNLQKTLRATTYLLLYNLMESTMTEVIHSIHETIKEENYEITDLSEKIHKVILKIFQKGLTAEKIHKIAESNENIKDFILDIGYNKTKLFNGNIDYKVIKKYCKNYGFEITPYEINGEKLLWDSSLIEDIKEKRNELAHGSDSFSNCGQNMPIDSILSNLDSVNAILLAVFKGLNTFLENRSYLRNP